ncbi:MAG: hypothetical protein MI742_05665, partial [Desulfobacterales bacterium]|nr:hypothetical protein [Desulfobacterales bacterium]
YYFVPLQTSCDAQIHVHSEFSSMREFIVTVMGSFAANAPKNTYLVFKHHPVDRGRTHYGNFIRSLSERLDLKGRVFYTHDVHLPSALKNALGAITINSTVGISSLYHRVPTLVLGCANYDIEGLTNKRSSLDHFWCDLKKPDAKLFVCFQDYIRRTTQIPGAFYAGFPDEFLLMERMTRAIAFWNEKREVERRQAG